MEKQKHIIFTVTNDLNYDQRMIRICTSMSEAGYKVTLVGLKRKKSQPLKERPYKQVRIPIITEQGKLMYADYWMKLFIFLLFKRYDVLCTIDLDTIVPGYFASSSRGKKRVYDGHELFTELKEVVTRPQVKKMWEYIEKNFLPRYPIGYTVGHYCSKYFKEKHGVDYAVVRNATVLKPLEIPEKKERYILYQGWVNEGRCFEELIPAMKHVDMPLVVCGGGNFYAQAVKLAREHGVSEKVIFKGFIPPDELVEYTKHATIGLMLLHAVSKNNEYSLANKYFDYMHNAVPQLCMNMPEYSKINDDYEVAMLINAPVTPESIAKGLNRLIEDKPYYEMLQKNCIKAREHYCWQNEEKTLLSVYDRVLST